MKILIASDHIGQDGTGRFLTYFANEMTKVSDFEVSLMLFHNEESHFLTYLSKDVNVINLNLKRSLKVSIHKIFHSIVKYKPDICLLGYTQLLVLGYLTPILHIFGIKVMFRDTIIPSIFHKNDSMFMNYINRYAYHRYDCIIAQSDDMRYDLVNNWGCNPLKIKKINNPVDIESVCSNAKSDCPEEIRNESIPVLVSAGRLDEQKGYDIAIQRIAEIKETLPHFKWLILGNGHMETELQKMIQDYRLDDRIFLLGFKKNVPAYLKYSNGLMLCSRYEGFPNIVLEALAVGTPVFSNQCLGGINEIIVEKLNGITCNFYEKSDFEKGLKTFFDTDFNSDIIQSDVRRRYTINHIMNQYEIFLRNYND